jgi:hypothetical protein
MWVKGCETEEMIKYLNNRRGDKRLMGVDSHMALNTGQVYYMTLIGGYTELYEMTSLFNKKAGFTVLFSEGIYNEGYWLEIYSEKASKAAGLKWLCEFYGFEKTICFGDNLNDIPMFKAADEAYAVRNADEEAKKFAKEVIGSNEENAVAEFIKRHYQTQKKDIDKA